jgi:parvulin-like peptidyl-prolyl isomerase
LLLATEFTDELQRSVASQFGEEFAAELANIKEGEWSGPVKSGYGVHLVFVTHRSEGRSPTLDEVHDDVRREVLNARRVEANQSFLNVLLAKYRVTIQWPQTNLAVAAGGAEFKR